MTSFLHVDLHIAADWEKKNNDNIKLFSALGRERNHDLPARDLKEKEVLQTGADFLLFIVLCFSHSTIALFYSCI